METNRILGPQLIGMICERFLPIPGTHQEGNTRPPYCAASSHCRSYCRPVNIRPVFSRSANLSGAARNGGLVKLRLPIFNLIDV